MMKTVVVIGVLLTACSGTDNEDTGCELAHRSGTYLVHYTEHSNGDCGALPDEVARVDDALALAPGCTLDAADDVSADACQLSRSFTCAGKDGSRLVVQSTTRERDGGATLTGVFSTQLLDSSGGYVCSSAYDLRYTRQ